MIIIENKQIALKFLKREQLCVLATSLKDKPIAATMACAVDNDLNLYLFTDKKSRKYKNLQKNKNVAIVVGVSGEKPSVQIDGKAELFEGDKAKHVRQMLLKADPKYESYFTETTAFIKVKPIRIFYMDYSKEQEFEYLRSS